MGNFAAFHGCHRWSQRSQMVPDGHRWSQLVTESARAGCARGPNPHFDRITAVLRRPADFKAQLTSGARDRELAPRNLSATRPRVRVSRNFANSTRVGIAERISRISRLALAATGSALDAIPISRSSTRARSPLKLVAAPRGDEIVASKIHGDVGPDVNFAKFVPQFLLVWS